MHSVEGLIPGAYFFRRGPSTLELLKEGVFRAEAHHLGLEQDLPADACVDIFFLANLGRTLEQYGNRGYRAVQFEAGAKATANLPSRPEVNCTEGYPLREIETPSFWCHMHYGCGAGWLFRRGVRCGMTNSWKIPATLPSAILISAVSTSKLALRSLAG